MTQNFCPSCESQTSIETDPTTGQRVCVNCGIVIQEIRLINEQTFVENTHGSQKATGTFIFQQNTFDSRTTFASKRTLSDAKDFIDHICSQLGHLSQEVCTQAQRIFTLALRERFTRGRTIEIVVGASIYVALRVKRTTGYFINDVARIISVNIYDLAATALTLSEVINIRLPTIDPALYIQRFCEELKFSNSSEIHDTALKVVQRLNRDWIQTGRNPAGVCGAAILIACKIHKADISKERILEIARVCKSTIKRRMQEIADTQFSNYTIAMLREDRSLIEGDSNELPPRMKVKRDIEILAEELKKPHEFKEDFSDDELKDVDGMLIEKDEAEKRTAMFYAMYKTKLNQKVSLSTKKKKIKKPKTSSKKKAKTDDVSLEYGKTDVIFHNIPESQVYGDSDFDFDEV